MTSPKAIIGVLLVLAIVPVGPGAVSAGDRTWSPDTPAKISEGNAVLLAATSPFEDLVEYALKGDRQAMSQAIIDYEKQAPQVLGALPADGRRDLQERMDRIKSARARGDDQAVAQNAVEAYRIIVEGLNPERLIVPVPVMLLDYVGFAQLVLLNEPSPDWPTLRETAGRARHYWDSIHSRVQDPALGDTVETMLAGMERGISNEDRAMTEFAARMDLALVDLIEAYFRQ